MRRFLRGRGGLVLLGCALPLLLLGVLLPVNRYRGLGFDGVDCDSPFHVLLFAVPAVVVYGAGTVANGVRSREPVRLLVALGCALACAAAGANAARGVAELRRNATESAGSCGDTAWRHGPPS